jgi:hypothetical protein
MMTISCAHHLTSLMMPNRLVNARIAAPIAQVKVICTHTDL